MIGLFANEKHAITNEIDVKKIEQIIDKIKYINDNLCHYVIKLYYEYSDIISENNVKDINEELKHKYKNNIMENMMDKYIMITTTFDNKEEANKIIEILLEKRLVSCCQLSNITSSYHWKGKIEHTEELLLQMKSKKELFKKIEKVILDNHSYETPQLIAYDIVDGYKGYLDWIGEETK